MLSGAQHILDVAWVASSCNAWMLLSPHLRALDVHTACFNTTEVAVPARIIVIDSEQNTQRLRLRWRVAMAAKDMPRLYCYDRTQCQTVAQQVPIDCFGFIHATLRIAQQCAQQSSQRRAHHVALHLSGPIAAQQLRALMKPRLVDPSSWAPSGSCLGNEPTACIEPRLLSTPLKVGLKNPQACFRFNTTQLAMARVVHVSAPIREACNAKAPGCPFTPSSWSWHGRNLIGPELLNTTLRPHHKRCALVGNGLSARGFGKAIDMHDAVIRINDAPTDAHFNVGTRTTYRITFCHAPTPRPRAGVKVTRSYCEAMKKPEAVDGMFSGPHTIWKGMHARWIGNRSLWRIKTRNMLCNNGFAACSTGLWAVAFALSTCGQINLFGYGPDVFAGGLYRYSRYYGRPVDTMNDTGHQYMVEMAKLHALHCNGHIDVRAHRHLAATRDAESPRATPVL